MLLKCCTQCASSRHRTRNGQLSFQHPKREMTKKCANSHTVVLISHASKVILKILQASLQQHVNQELPDIQAGFRKGRRTRNQITNIHGQRESKGIPVKHVLLLYWIGESFWLWITTKCGKFLRRWWYQTTLPVSREICSQEATSRTGHGTTDWLKIGK